MKRRTALKYLAGGVALAAAGPRLVWAADKKKRIVFIAGRKSHGYGSHAHNAGCLLLAKRLAELPNVETEVFLNGEWPKPEDLENADEIVIFCDGGGGHVIMPHLDEVEKLMKKGVGLSCMHYGVEIPKGRPGDCLKEWTGGYFETFWSVNPHWVAEFKEFPKHPAANGLKPFTINDEWYYHMRFKDNMEGVTPILSAIPPKETLNRPDGPHSGNPDVRKTAGQPQHLLWLVERPDGGRGMGFTGGHYHWSWGDDNFRTAVLNAIAWVAKIDIPPGGIPSKTPTLEELKQNQDYPPPKDMTQEDVEKTLYPGGKK
jgi:hypothetical protein